MSGSKKEAAAVAALGGTAARAPKRPVRANESTLGLLRVEDVARELDVSVTSAWRLVHSRALPCVRYSRKLIRVHRDDLVAYVQKLRGGQSA